MESADSEKRLQVMACLQLFELGELGQESIRSFTCTNLTTSTFVHRSGLGKEGLWTLELFYNAKNIRTEALKPAGLKE